jgi:hypothetical protein
MSRLSIAICNPRLCLDSTRPVFGVLMFRRIESSNGVLVGEYGIGIVTNPGL